MKERRAQQLARKGTDAKNFDAGKKYTGEKLRELRQAQHAKERE